MARTMPRVAGQNPPAASTSLSSRRVRRDGCTAATAAAVPAAASARASVSESTSRLVQRNLKTCGGRSAMAPKRMPVPPAPQASSAAGAGPSRPAAVGISQDMVRLHKLPSPNNCMWIAVAI